MSADDQVKHLIRTVTRTFYDYQCVLIIDALLFHSVLFEDDLARLTSMNKKNFRSSINPLIEDRLVVPYIQKEDVGSKYGNRTYFYIHFIEAIDSIKWKIHCIVRDVKKQFAKTSEVQGYICPNCGQKFSLIDAASLVNDSRTNFVCSTCHNNLVEDNSDQEAKQGQEKLEKLMKDLQGIIESLKIIDSMKIEDNNFETSLIKSIPAQSSSTASYTVSNKIGRNKNSFFKMSESLQNAAKRSQATIHVNITAEDEASENEKKERELKNAKLAQNALPDWHVQSTVGHAELGHLNEEDDEENGEVKLEEGDESVKVEGEDGNASSSDTKIKSESVPEKDSDVSEDVKSESSPFDLSTKEGLEEKTALFDYYQKLKERQNQEDLEDEEEDDGEGSEFEDFIDDDEEEEENVNPQDQVEVSSVNANDSQTIKRKRSFDEAMGDDGNSATAAHEDQEFEDNFDNMDFEDDDNESESE